METVLWIIIGTLPLLLMYKHARKVEKKKIQEKLNQELNQELNQLNKKLKKPLIEYDNCFAEYHKIVDTFNMLENNTKPYVRYFSYKEFLEKLQDLLKKVNSNISALEKFDNAHLKSLTLLSEYDSLKNNINELSTNISNEFHKLSKFSDLVKYDNGDTFEGDFVGGVMEWGVFTFVDGKRLFCNIKNKNAGILYYGRWEYTSGDYSEGMMIDEKGRYGPNIYYWKETNGFAYQLWLDDEWMDNIVARLVEEKKFDEAIDLCNDKLSDANYLNFNEDHTIYTSKKDFPQLPADLLKKIPDSKVLLKEHIVNIKNLKEQYLEELEQKRLQEEKEEAEHKAELERKRIQKKKEEAERKAELERQRIQQEKEEEERKAELERQRIQIEKEMFEEGIASFWENNLFHKNLPLAAFESLVLESDGERRFPEIIKLGSIKNSTDDTIKLPFFIPLHHSNGLALITQTNSNKKHALKAIELLAFRLLLSIPDGKTKFYIIDAENSGQSFSNLFGLDSRILEKEIWDDDSEIISGLRQIKNSIPRINSELLTTKYNDLNDYNKKVKHSKQAFQFVLIANFPRGFTGESADLLLSILTNGQKAGVYCIMTYDYASPMPFSEFAFNKFRNIAVDYNFESNKITNIDGHETINNIFYITEIDSELPANINELKDEINSRLDKVQKISIESISDDQLWKSSSAKGITIPIGATSEDKVLNFQLGDGVDVHHALIGGATGKGKTVLLHNIIINAAKLYSPKELQLVLMDYKEGTEFNVYKDLPNLKILTSSSEIEFGLSVIEFLNEEIINRGNLFKKEGVADFTDYKKKSKDVLPRYLIIMDEFQVLLSPNKRTTSKISALIEDLTRRGRSFGINLILSSQSLGDVDLSASTLGQLGVRIALSMPEHDCIRMLHMDNDIPVSFTKAGQALYNTSMGRKEGNTVFQVAFIEKDNIKQELSKLPAITEETKIEMPFIFDGNNDVKFEDNERFMNLMNNKEISVNELFSDIFIGEPIYLSKNHLLYRIRKQQESNVLIIGDDPMAAISIVYHSNYQIALQSTEISKFFIFSMFSIDSGLQNKFDVLTKLSSNIKIFTKGKDLQNIVEEIKKELELRYEDDQRKGRIVLSLMNFNTIRELKNTEYGMSQIASDLNQIIKNGPEYGIHCIIHTLNKKSLDDIFEYNFDVQFENKILLKGLNPIDFGADIDETITKWNTGFLISPVSKYGADKINIYNINNL